MDLIKSGKKEGAKLGCGGSHFGDQGFFTERTVFSDVQEIRIAIEEIFGPIMQVLKSKTMSDVLQ